MLTALACALIPASKIAVQRTLSLGASLALVATSFFMVSQTMSGEIFSYAMGSWSAPFGIVVVVDRLSALMVALTSVVALCVLAYASQGSDKRGPYFHFLFQFQVVGICGAFLTGDIFNLFVFFEILLLASYNLLLQGGGLKRAKAALHYVVLNLIGSAILLVAVAILYGLLGTLNMADMAVRVRQLGAADAPLVAAAAILLLLVFGLKAAVVPVYFWLPRAYASASAPVAALFAIMTKVGVYAIIRVYSLIFGSEASELADLAQPWLWPLGLATLSLGV